MSRNKTKILKTLSQIALITSVMLNAYLYYTIRRLERNFETRYYDESQCLIDYSEKLEKELDKLTQEQESELRDQINNN